MNNVNTMNRFIFITLAYYYYYYYIKEQHRDGTRSTQECNKNHIENLVKKCEERRPLQSPKHVWKTVLIQILKK